MVHNLRPWTPFDFTDNRIIVFYKRKSITLVVNIAKIKLKLLITHNKIWLKVSPSQRFINYAYKITHSVIYFFINTLYSNF